MLLQYNMKQYSLPITPMPCTIYLAGFKQWAVGNPGDGNDNVTDLLLVLFEILVICSSLNFNVKLCHYKKLIMVETFHSWGQYRL